MLSWRKRSAETEAPHAGAEALVDALLALYRVEDQATDNMAVCSTASRTGSPEWPFSEWPLSPGGRGPIRLENPPDIAGILGGWAASGRRAAAFMRETDLARASVALSEPALLRTPFVLHAVGRTGGLDTQSAGDSRSQPVRGPGISFAAANPQEALDLALIAHHVAELALVPVVCRHLGAIAPFSAEYLRVPEAELIGEFLGRSSDIIPSPTPAQVLAFGEKRRRIPRMLDPSRPMGIGAPMSTVDSWKAELANRVFFEGHAEALLAQALRAYAGLTGRSYPTVESYFMEDAEVVVVCAGATTRDFVQAAESIRRSDKIKAGVVQVRLLHPFPEAELAEATSRAGCITVVTESAGHQPADLSQAVRTALGGRTNRSSGALEILTCEVPSNAAAIAQEEAIEVFRNMSGERRPLVATGVRSVLTTRLPRIERLDQLIRRDYPDLQRRTLRVNRVRSGAGERPRVVHILSSAVPYMYHAGRALAHMIDVRTDGIQYARPEDGRTTSLTRGYTIVSAGSDITGSGGGVDILAVDDVELFRNMHVVSAIRNGGKLIVALSDFNSLKDDALAGRIAERLRGQRIDVFQTSSAPRGADRQEHGLSVSTVRTYNLVGAVLKVGYGLDPTSDPDIGVLYCSALGLPGMEQPVAQALADGAEHLTPVKLESAGDREVTVPETFRDQRTADETLFDPARFWDDVGYPHVTGRSDAKLIDPYLGTATIPGRTGLFADLTKVRNRTPRLIPEGCTGCGLCHAWCPEAALPPSIRSVEELIEGAIDQYQTISREVSDLARYAKNLGKIATRMLRRDELNQFRWLGELVSSAGEDLIGRLDVDDEQRERLFTEIRSISALVETYPLVRTERFYSGPETENKGTGLVFSMALDAAACTGCGICFNVCPEDAIELVHADSEYNESVQCASRFASGLAPLSSSVLERFVAEGSPDTEVIRLMDGASYRSMSGADIAAAGSGTRTTLHLVASVCRGLVNEPLSRHLAHIDGVTKRLESEIQERLSGSVQVDDVEEFARRLDEVTGQRVGVDDLVRMAAADTGPSVEVDDMRQLTEVLRRLREIRGRYPESAGETAPFVSVLSTDTARRLASYPYNPFDVPWIAVGRDAVAGAARGLFDSALSQISGEFAELRRAELVLDGVYDPHEHFDFLQAFGWRDFSQQEWDASPRVVAFVWNEIDQAADLLRSGLPIKVVRLTDLSGPEHPVGSLEASLNGSVFVAQSTAGAMDHLLGGLRRGFAHRGPALFNLYCADPSVHGFEPDMTADLMRLAVESRAFPVFVFDPGEDDDWSARLRLGGNPSVEVDWVADESSAGHTMTVGHWGIRQSIYSGHFSFVPQSAWKEGMVPLQDLVSLSESNRVEATPILVEQDGSGREMRFAVSPVFVRFAEKSLKQWRLLQELAGVSSALEKRVRTRLENDIASRIAQARNEVASDYDARIAQETSERTSSMHSVLTERLLQLSGFGHGLPQGDTTLRDFASQKDDSVEREDSTPPSSSVNGNE